MARTPLSPDTDRGGLSDSEDEYPLSPASIELEIGVLEIGRSIVPGAVFGECGIEGGSLEGFVDSEIASSAFSGKDSYSASSVTKRPIRANKVVRSRISFIPDVAYVVDSRDAIKKII